MTRSRPAAGTTDQPPTQPATGPVLEQLSEHELYRWIGLRIRVLRIMTGLTQDQVADKTGLSRNFISNVELGRHGSEIIRLAALAAALGITLADLLNVNYDPTTFPFAARSRTGVGTTPPQQTSPDDPA